ncbi:hypothetical protein K3495_g7743 [Podosphaera aphanis]|nr:hypothetical protein K3495_g7743 [Podosphaera aphanis]
MAGNKIPEQSSASETPFSTNTNSFSNFVKFDKLPVLTGSDNYRRWAGSWQIAFDSMGLWEVLIGELSEPPRTETHDFKFWQAANKHLRAVILNAVDENLQTFVIDHPTITKPN